MIWLLRLLALVLALTALQTLLFYLFWALDRRRHPPALLQPLVPWKVVRTVVLEWWAMSLMVLAAPLRFIPWRRRLRPAAGAVPVVLVHGYGGDHINFLAMQWWLRWHGFSQVHAVSYVPPVIDARRLAQQVVDHVQRIRAATGAAQVDLVCHSMGGPLTRYALQHLGLAGQVRRAVFLGSPLAGTRLSNLLPIPGAAHQLRYQSPFLSDLNRLGEPPGDCRFYAIYSDMDNFVFPADSARVAVGENIHLPYHGHCALLYSPQVLRRVVQCLDQPEPAA